MKYQRISIGLDPELIRDLRRVQSRILARGEKCSISQLVRRAIKQFLERELSHESALG